MSGHNIAKSYGSAQMVNDRLAYRQFTFLSGEILDVAAELKSLFFSATERSSNVSLIAFKKSAEVIVAKRRE